MRLGRQRAKNLVNANDGAANDGGAGNPATRVERYLAHLETLAGGVEPTFNMGDRSSDGPPPVTAIRYENTPEPGLMLGLTYGLSLVPHPEWRTGTAELIVCVRSDDPGWPAAIATVATLVRGDCPFAYGNALGVGEPLTDDTQMDGFVVFAPLVLDPADARIDVGDEQPIFLKGMYPTYASERDFIAEHGLEAFWQLDWDPYDVRRPPVV